MFKRLKDHSNFFNRIINFSVANEKDTFSLEQITSDTFLFSATIVSVLSCIFNFFENFPLPLQLFTIFSSLVLMFLYYLSRFRKYYNIWLSATTVLILLSVSWFMNGGGVGSVSFMYLCTLMILNFIASSNQQNKLFIIVLFNIIILYLSDYFWGEVLVHEYPDKKTQYFDIAFVFSIILFCVFFSTRYIKRSYEKERNLVKEKTRELEVSNEKRTNVFINLAHETKTPLTLITNYLEDYMRKNGKEEEEELKLLKKSIDNLTKDIVNFFDMEKIQKGISIYNHNSLCDFSELLTNSIKLFKVIAAKKQMEITSEISEKIYVKSDPNALQRIVNNLIENAIKYTPNGGCIEISLKKTDNKAQLSIKDNGIGIPELLQEKIFEPYYQINSQKANFQGIGLGLSIVKKIITEIGGSIEIQSNPAKKEQGTRMNVSLLLFEKEKTDELKNPDTEPFYYDVQTIQIPSQVFDEEKFTILIVEDDIALLNYIVCSLQKNYNIIYVLSGGEAVEKLKTIAHVDLIVSDVMMDNGDGFFLYNYVLSSKKMSHVPFIFLTANHSNDSRMQGLTMGAIDYISKPVYIDELNKKINSVLKSFVNQRNAIITHAYHTILGNKKTELQVESSSNVFESNCFKYNLTAREIEVIRLMIEGKITKEIAGELHISVDTVKKHIQNSYDKVDVGNKFDLLKRLMS